MPNPLRDFVAKRLETKLTQAKPDAVDNLRAKYEFKTWVADASQRAGQLNLTTHPSTFSHPDAKTTPISFQGRASPDGYVRSGNVPTDMDAFGNAAALDVLAFVKMLLADGRSFLEHLEQRSSAAMELLEVDQDKFESLRSGFLRIKENSKGYPTTVQEVKQVYYPVDVAAQDYHLLSVLTPSGWIKSNRIAIGEREWGEDAKERTRPRRTTKHRISSTRSSSIV